MSGWTNDNEQVREEVRLATEDGRAIGDVDGWYERVKDAGQDKKQLSAIRDELLALQMRSDYPFVEPNHLAGIQALRPAPMTLPQWTLDDDQLYDRLHGAWLGRCCGCALGKPVEGFMSPKNELTSRGRIKSYLMGADAYPLTDYFPAHSTNEQATGKLICAPSQKENIAYMESDDDIRYTCIGQLVLEHKGYDFTTWDVAETWWYRIPYRHVCTAETQAYRNLVNRYSFRIHNTPDDIDWQWVATHENPYREWIGADIRADSWGYANPGNPALAAEMAWRDARMSHVKNGIYGSMFIAAMIATAFVSDDPLTIIQSGLAQIPTTCRLYHQMHQVIDICRKHQCDATEFESVYDQIEALLGHYHAVHTNNNAGVVVAALLLGQHDFQKVITLAVMAGWDSDCTGASAGSIAGAMLGAKKLPEKWTKPLNDTLYASITEYHPAAISQCAKRSLKIIVDHRNGTHVAKPIS